MRVRVVVVAALVVGLVAGCAQRGTTGAAPVTTADPPEAAIPSYAPISAADACPAGAPIHLSDDVTVITQAYLCVQEFRTVPGDGEWEFSVVKGVTSGLQAVVRAYRTPDAPPTDGSCDAVYRDPLVLYLRGSRTVAVRAPQDGCGQPSGAAVRAHDALGTVDITVKRLAQVTTPLAQTSGCSDTYKDMLSIEESMGGPRQVAKAPRPVGAGAEVCVYAVTRDPQGIPVGRLTSARALTPAEGSQLNTELTKTTVDASCARSQHTRFALLQTGGQGGGPTTIVALDGCAVQQDGGWWRAPDRLRSLVSG